VAVLRLSLSSLALIGFGLAASAGILLWVIVSPSQAVPTTTTSVTLSEQVQDQVDALAAEAQAVQADIEELNLQVSENAEAYNQCVADLESVNERLLQLRREVANAQADKKYREDQLAERIRSVYKSGGRDQLLQLLLFADGMEDLYKRFRLVATLADQDRNLVSNLKESTTRLDLLVEAAGNQKREELKLRRQLSEQIVKMQTTIAEREQTLAGLDTRVRAVIEQERQRQKEEQERLRREMEARLQAALEAARNHVLNGGQVYAGKLPLTDDEVLNQVLETAVCYMGIPYVWGGSRPSAGLDCSGFVRYVFKQHGVNLPHYSGYQAQMGIPVTLAEIQPGDVVAFGYPVHHVGIYIGEGLFIHTPGDYVKIQKLSSRQNLSAIRRFPLEMRTGDPLFE
jgi:cell wall-associated NlpC family hydrolase